MVKKYKIALSALLVVLTVFAVITVTGVVDINRLASEKESNSGDNTEEIPKTFENDFNQYTAAGLPIMKTDIDGVYFTVSKKGDVAFYKIAEKNIEKLEETGTFEVTVSCSKQKIPVVIHYIEVDSQTAGYGVFTNENYPEIYLYDYAFFKVTNQFSAYDSKSDLLLLVDWDKDRIYDENKVYSESFYLYSSKETKEFLNEDQRIPDLNAVLRTDYKMFTDDILHQEQSKILFFSSRSYNDYDYSSTVDIYMSGGYGENVDNNRYIIDVASLNFWRTQDGTLYFAEKTTTDENGESKADGFALFSYDGENTTEAKAFDGSLSQDYILSGEWILNRKSGEIYNVVTGEEKKLDYTQFETSFTPDLFEMSENGKYCIVRGENNLGKPALGFMNFESELFLTYSDNVFGYVVSMQALDDGTAVINLAAGEKSSTYYQLIGPITVSEEAANPVG